MKVKMLLSVIFAIAFFATMHAQTATPKVSERQVKQQKRIKHGVNEGDLTKGEVYRLQKQQAGIHHAKKQARADGTVTRGERARLHAHQNKASRNIYRQKNDGQSRN